MKYIKNILVTGNNGVLGKTIMNLLGERAIPFRPPHRDVLNEKHVEDAIGCADAVIHCAAIISSDIKNRKNYQVNYLGTELVLSAAEKRGIPFVQISSQAVYGCPESPVKETQPLFPLNDYALSKLKAEQICGNSRVPVAILRVSSMYNNDSLQRKEVLGNLISQALQGKMVIYGKGRRIIDLVYVEDVAKAAIAMIGETRIYNVGCGRLMTMGELVAILKEMIGGTVYFDETKPEVKGFWLDISKLQSKITYTPTNLENGLRFMGF